MSRIRILPTPVAPRVIYAPDVSVTPDGCGVHLHDGAELVEVRCRSPRELQAWLQSLGRLQAPRRRASA